MSIQGFKNLIKASTFLDESFQQLLKKSDESRRSSKMSLEYIQTLHKLFTTLQSVFERLLMDNSEEIQQKATDSGTKFFHVLQRIFSIHNSFSKKMSNNIKETIQMGNNLFKEYSNLILSFQSVIRTYIKNQQNLAEHSKKYFKMQKNMLQSVELYKASFTDVKLVYNADERIKRYIACENTYKAMLEEVRHIEEKLIFTNQLKKEVIENYKNIEYEFVSAIKIIGNRVITLAELFAFQFNGMLNNLTTFLQQTLANPIEPEQLPFFALEMPINQEFFNVPIIKQECKKYPYFIIYSAQIKPQYFPQVSKLNSNYTKEISEKVEARKRSSKILFQFTYNYLKQFQKIFVSYVRDININYEKNKKKMSELYGNQHLNFIRVFSVIFEKIIDKGETLSRAASMKIKFIENLVQEESKVMDAYLKQLKTLGEKVSKKKETKKAANKNGAQNQEDSNVDDFLRIEIQQKSQTSRYLIDNFFNKINQSQNQLNIHYNSIVSDFSNYSRQLYEFCRRLHDQQFQQSNFLKTYQAFQAQADEIMKLKIGFFNDLSFGTLLLGGGEQIVFEPELNKFDEFKKLKKPAELQTFKVGEGLKRKDTVEDKSNDAEDNCPQSTKRQENQTTIERTPQRPQKTQKFLKQLDFLMSKISFQPHQRLRECYSCGLSDKIILSGWLYITTHRLCFHSKFNPSNIFFGDTFIQIPKKDIIKIQKRQNGIIFNNSISVTTINGQVFFTSFISRNEAFETISQVFEISYNDDFMFQPSDENYNLQTLMEETQQDDDLKQDSIQKRRGYIDKHLENFEYIEIYSTEFQFNGLNAYKYFKLFETSNDIPYNRKTYKGFNMYMKEFLDHKEINMGQWTPDISPYLNPKNIKENCPLQFHKTSTSIIPVANSGIPLMPKQAHLQENIKLFFESKDKYIVQMKIQNGGIPYCQYFNIRYKKVVQSCAQNKCKLTLYYFIQFVQKTMMKSVIQSKSIEQSKTAMNRQETQMKKYLKYLEKQQSKPKKEEDSKENWAYKICELEKQIEQSKEHEEQLLKTVEDCKSQSQKDRKKFLISLAFNVILILLLISIC